MATITLKETTVARLWVEYTTTTNIEANTSTTTLSLKLTTLNNYNIGPWGDFNGSYFGSTSDTFDGAIPNFQGTRTLKTVTKTVNHNNDGTGSLAVQWKWGVNSPWGGYQNPSGSFTITLPNIPRATTPVLNKTTANLGDSITITLNRATSSYTHNLALIYGDKSLSIGTGVATTKTWTIPDSVANWMPRADMITAQVRAQTYNSAGNLVGTKTVNIVLKVPDRLGPTISSVTVEEGSTVSEDIGLFVKDYSTLHVETSASAKYSATVSSIQATIDGTTYTGADFTTNVIRTAGSLEIKVTVTDSRGKTATHTQTITITDYSPPQITSFTARRADSGGNIKENGTHAQIAYVYEITPLNNKNSKSIKIQYKLTSASEYTDLATLTEYSADSFYLTGSIFALSDSYDVRIVLEDSFTSSTAQVKIETERVPLELYRSGLGVSIGKAAELDETFDVDLYTRFRKGLSFDNKVFFNNGLTTKLNTISAGDNLNNYTSESGIYYVSGAVENRPVSGGGWLICLANGTNSIYQKYITLTGLTYERIKDSNGWSIWCGWYFYTIDQQTNTCSQVYVGLDGRYEAFGELSLSANFAQQINGVYQSQYQNIQFTLTRPQDVKLTGKVHAFCEMNADNLYILSRYTGHTTANTPVGYFEYVNFKIATLANISAFTAFTAQIHVVGRWK